MSVMLARGLTKTGSYDVVTTVREGIGAASVAGGIVITNFDKAGYRGYSQASPGVPGDVGTEHWFGWELARRSGGASDSLVTAAIDHQQACGTGLLMETSGVPLAEAQWTLVPPQVGNQPCPNSWPYSLAR
jgi:hypothetical protein